MDKGKRKIRFTFFVGQILLDRHLGFERHLVNGYSADLSHFTDTLTYLSEHVYGILLHLQNLLFSFSNRTENKNPPQDSLEADSINATRGTTQIAPENRTPLTDSNKSCALTQQYGSLYLPDGGCSGLRLGRDGLAKLSIRTRTKRPLSEKSGLNRLRHSLFLFD